MEDLTELKRLISISYGIQDLIFADITMRLKLVKKH